MLKIAGELIDHDLTARQIHNIQGVFDYADSRIQAGWRLSGKAMSFGYAQIAAIREQAEQDALEIARIDYSRSLQDISDLIAQGN